MPNDVSAPVTPRRRFITALEGGRPTGHVPTFELVFHLTMESFGKVHPTHRAFAQWDQMSPRERERQIADTATPASRWRAGTATTRSSSTAPPTSRTKETPAARHLRERTGAEYFLMRHGDATLGMPGGGYVFSTSNCVYTGMALGATSS